MRLEKRLFERFLKGVKEWLPSYYDSIVDTATIDDVGYKMGFDKQTPTSGAKKPVGKLFGIVKDE